MMLKVDQTYCLDGAELDQVRRWLEEFAAAEAAYHAVMTRRCLNLMELVLSRYGDEMSDWVRQRFDCVMTENALLLQAEQVAKSYLLSGRFPRIMLADDLLVHGRSINRFFQTFQELVLRQIRALDAEVDPAGFEADFYRSIELWVFSENDTTMLLQPELQKRVRSCFIWPEEKWRDFSVRVANTIYSSNFSNTSYVVSAKLRLSDTKHSEWKNLSAWMAGRQEKKGWIPFSPERKGLEDADVIYVHPLAQQYDRIFPSVRVYEKTDGVLLIPYFFAQFTVDEAKDAVRLLRESREECRNGAARKVLDVVDDTANNEMLYPVMTQMIYLIFSQITLSCFLSDLLDEEALSVRLEYDTKKIARNFSDYEPGQETKAFSHALDSFCEICWSPDLLDTVCKRFRFSGGPAQIEDIQPVWCSEEALLRVMEETIYQQAIEHERRAKKAESLYISGGQLPANILDITGERPVHAFIASVLSKAQAEKRDLSTNLAVLYDLTHEMDVGDVSLKARAECVDDAYICYSAVRNTELSLSILPRRLGRFYPNILEVTRAFWREKEFPEWTRWYFAEVLSERDADASAYTEDAVAFARVIQENKLIINTLLNWDPKSFDIGR